MRLARYAAVLIVTVAVWGMGTGCGFLLNDDSVDQPVVEAELPEGGGGGTEPGGTVKEVPAYVTLIADDVANFASRIALSNIFIALGVDVDAFAPSISMAKSAELPTLVEQVEIGCYSGLASVEGPMSYAIACAVGDTGDTFSTHGYTTFTEGFVVDPVAVEGVGMVDPLILGRLNFNASMDAPADDVMGFDLVLNSTDFSMAFALADASMAMSLKAAAPLFPAVTLVGAHATGAFSSGGVSLTPISVVLRTDEDEYDCSLAVGAAASCVVVEEECTPSIEVCADDIDNDCDGLVDDDDPDCSPIVEDCANGKDDDGDGFVDCSDVSCAAAPACAAVAEICNDFRDNNGDKLADCWDPLCQSAPACSELKVVNGCIDGYDNDSDGVVDCDDPDCAGNAPCAKAAVEDCTNFDDDDGDGFFRCHDVDCMDSGYCGPNEDCYYDWMTGELICSDYEFCNNGIDDDGDGLIDCQDDNNGMSGMNSCAVQPFCKEPSYLGAECRYDKNFNFTPDCCEDDTDNDNNGPMDCDDRSCSGFPVCNEAGWVVGITDTNGNLVPDLCEDGDDNDGNDRTDCADSACRAYYGPNLMYTCREDRVGACWDNVNKRPRDDDGNGLPDCCEDGEDNDGDDSGIEYGYPMNTDCMDVDCDIYDGCNEALLPPYGDADHPCADGVDNDGNGQTDCLDTDCASINICNEAIHPDCGGDPMVCCHDSENNDDDYGYNWEGTYMAMIDCDDSDCSGLATCNESNGEDADGNGVPDSCEDGIDNDLDGMTDCDDTNCKSFPQCNEALMGGSACDDDIDNDSDGLTDCEDPDCDRASIYDRISGINLYLCEFYCDPTWPPEFVGCTYPEGCSDGTDNDGDGLFDCYDGGCMNAPQCMSELNCLGGGVCCNDGEDSDADGAIDCADSDCDMYSACEVYEPEVVIDICADGEDNDLDGLTDCDDAGCSTSPACSCGDGICGASEICAVDCVAETNMPDCMWYGAECYDHCGDGANNDEDDFTDCDDPDCYSSSNCIESDCADGADNDGDNLTDCEDPDCDRASLYNPESGLTLFLCEYYCDPAMAAYYTCTYTNGCSDETDNDGDGLYDCQDPGCAQDPSCSCGNDMCEWGEVCPADCPYETNCYDGVDNDGDGSADCFDPDCAAMCGGGAG